MLYHARMVVDERLHLSSLLIENFRGIESLTIPKLGRVTLLTGKNGVGKSTVLEAVQVYATQGRPDMLHHLLVNRQEITVVVNREGNTINERVASDITALFHGWSASQETRIVVGPVNSEKVVQIEPAEVPEPDTLRKLMDVLHKSEDDVYALNVAYQGTTIHPANEEHENPPGVRTVHFGPGLVDTEFIADHWKHVVLRDGESQAIEALRVIDDSVDRVTVIGDSPSSSRAIVKLTNYAHPVPLRSLGDGAVRLFAIALALANSRDGFLLIDEAENGIHHSIQQGYWRMVLQAAHDNNVQVIATTHSWDCVRAFAQASVENEDVEGMLYRLESDEKGHYVVDYPEKELKIAADQGIEVR